MNKRADTYAGTSMTMNKANMIVLLFGGRKPARRSILKTAMFTKKNTQGIAIVETVDMRQNSLSIVLGNRKFHASTCNPLKIVFPKQMPTRKSLIRFNLRPA
jgi:hypothetical protein